jgi:hypothetical protein
VGTIVKQNRLRALPLSLTGKREAVLPAIFPVTPSQRPGRILLQGLVTSCDGRIFILADHAGSEFCEPPQSFLLPNLGHLFPEPEAPGQVETQMKQLSLDDMTKIRDLGRRDLEGRSKPFDEIGLLRT